MADHLFAYGTLQPALAPVAIRRFVARFALVGPATAAGQLYDLGAYPAATFGDAAPGRVVRGRVYRLPDNADVWPALDAYEGTPTLYVRRRLSVTLEDGRPLTCWAYQYSADLTGHRPIASGVYAPRAPTA